MKTTLALVLLTSPAFADELPYLDDGTTRFGTLTIADTQIDGDEAQTLQLDGNPIDGLTDRFVGLRAMLPRPDGADADWALVSMANGGNGCPMLWAFVEITTNGATPTEPFGTCSESVQNPRIADTSVALDMDSFDPAFAYYTYTFDGQSVTETPVPQTTTGATIPGADDDVTRWIDQHPASLFDDVGERLRFMQIMTEDQVYDLATRVEVAEVAFETEGWVVGQGFDSASGGDITGMWGIRIDDGATFAVLMDTASGPQAFGAPRDEWPQIAIEFLGAP